MEEEGRYGKSLRPEGKHGPSLELEIPLQPPPASPEKMSMIKVSNIMGIEPKPFDPETYVQEDSFVTDESGTKSRIRLGNNIVRWRTVINPDGTTSRESNARFVRWSDGSMQLLIGNEVLDTSEQDAHHDQAHLFRRHGKGIFQSQGRLLRKMRCMPSSLSSNSHRQLTALVDSRHKKGYKVKNCITDIDPEKEKEEKEKAESQSTRANVLLHRKRGKVKQKYPPTVDRRRQLSPGFLEDALDEKKKDDETYYRDSRHSKHHFKEDLEVEALAEKRIMNAKKSQGLKDIPRKSSLAPAKFSRGPMESENKTDGVEDERAPSPKLAEDTEPEYEDEDEDEEEEEQDNEEEAQVNDASNEEEEEKEYLEEEVQVNDASDEEGEEKEHYEEEAQVDDAAEEEEEEEEPKQKSKQFGGNVKGKGFESDKDS